MRTPASAPPAGGAAVRVAPLRHRLLAASTALLTGAALLAGGLATAPGARAQAVDQAWGVPSQAWVTIRGRGYGHGHGMSQHGAEGAARQGRTATQILRFYYPRTTVGRAGGTVSVLVTADTTDDLVVRPPPGLQARALRGGQTWTLPEGPSRWRLVATRDGRTGLARLTDRWRRWRTFDGDGEFLAGGRPVTLVTPAGERAYRGSLRAAAPSGGSASRDTVNVVSLENYLRGVVPLEIPALWRPAAVQAQAVAARTYAAYERAHPRAAHYQICDTTSCQVYGGASAEHPATDAAIRATRRTALLHEGRPAFTQFSSSSGGWTSQGSMPYLTAREDPYDGWSGNSVHTWSVRVPDTTLERAYPRIGDLRRIRVSERDGNGEWGGRVDRMTLVGGRGSVTVTGDTLRSALGLRSSWFTFGVAGR